MQALTIPSTQCGAAIREFGARVLFIGHDASRTGAPILLLQFMRWLKANTQIKMHLLLGDGGPLLADYRREVDTTVLGHEWRRSPDDPIWLKHIPKARSVLGRVNRNRVRAAARSFSPDLIYSNTTATASVLRCLRIPDVPMIVHMHEMAMCVKTYVGEDNAAEVLSRANAIIAVSRAVSDYARDHFAIAPAQIELVHGFVPMPAVAVAASTTAQIRNELNVPDDAIVVGSTGTPDWRKGVDLQIQLALQVKNRNTGPPIYFVWLGGQTDSDTVLQLRHDAEHAGVAEYIRCVSTKSNPLDYMSAFDVFALLSREDPYPIVMLEAAALGKPILCFAGAGGAPDFVEDDCGIIVPYLDIPKMAERVLQLATAPEIRHAFGQAARKKVCHRHDIGTTATRLVEIIQRVASSTVLTTSSVYRPDNSSREP